MRRKPEQWLPAILALLAVLCGGLAWLQYRWTGELSRNEMERLKASLRTQLEQMTQAFDSELARSVAEYVPTSGDLDRKGWKAAHRERWEQAAGRNDRPIFRRVLAAVPNAKSGIELYEFDGGTGEPSEVPWPAEWKPLEERLQRMAQGEPVRGSILDRSSALLEVPVFGEQAEREWMLFEVDLQYVRETWIPELVKAHLNPGPEPYFEVKIIDQDSQAVRFATSAARFDAADASAGMFPERTMGGGGRGREGGREGGKRGGKKGGKKGSRGGGNSDSRWQMLVRHRSGSIDAEVARVRRRNLGVALGGLALIAVTSFVLVRYSLRSRRLAEMEFQFVAGVSHELRTPLTVIRGAGHNLLSGVVQEPAQRETYLRMIVRHADLLSDMVEQLLSYASLRHNPTAVRTEALELRPVIEAAIELAAGDLAAGRLVLELPSSLPRVKGEAAALRRVFQNLIGNAVSHGTGRILLSGAVVGEWVEVRVSDEGPGIPAEELPMIFEPFFRGGRARGGKLRGTGLGLSLVKEIVAGMGGDVKAESVVGSGSTFTVRLPVERG